MNDLEFYNLHLQSLDKLKVATLLVTQAASSVALIPGLSEEYFDLSELIESIQGIQMELEMAKAKITPSE